MVVFSIIVIALYFYVRTRTSPIFSDSSAPQTELEKLLEKDILNNYPSSPREVIKLYSRLTKVLYNENLKEEQINQLAKQINNLYDAELIANNAKDDYTLNLQVEISGYKKANRVIIQYEVEASDAVQYWEKEEKSYASLVTSYTIKEDDNMSKTFEEFILREDKEGKWKILGWELSDKTEIESE